MDNKEIWSCNVILTTGKYNRTCKQYPVSFEKGKAIFENFELKRVMYYFGVSDKDKEKFSLKGIEKIMKLGL